jgi:hypothetical protein
MKEIEEKLLKLNKEKNFLLKEFNKKTKLISNAFNTLSIKPQITTNEDSTRSNLSIFFSMEDLFSISFGYTLTKDLQCKKSIEKIKYKENYNDNKNKVKEIIEEIKNLTINLKNEEIIETLIFIKEYLVKNRKLDKKIKIYTNELMLIKNKSKIEDVKSIFVPFKSFCINTFLCKENGIVIEGENPSKKEIKQMKEIIEKNKKNYYFLIMDFNEDNVNIKPVALSSYQGRFEVHCNGVKVSGIKKINSLLANQIKYKNKTLSYDKGICYMISFDINEFLNNDSIKEKLNLITNIKNF